MAICLRYHFAKKSTTFRNILTTRRNRWCTDRASRPNRPSEQDQGSVVGTIKRNPRRPKTNSAVLAAVCVNSPLPYYLRTSEKLLAIHHSKHIRYRVVRSNPFHQEYRVIHKSRQLVWIPQLVEVSLITLSAVNLNHLWFPRCSSLTGVWEATEPGTMCQ